MKGRPEAENLIGIYSALAGVSPEKVLQDFGGAQFSSFKQSLAELAIDKLGPIGAEMRRLEGDPGYIEQVLRDGALRARAIAQPIMEQVKDIVGLLR